MPADHLYLIRNITPFRLGDGRLFSTSGRIGLVLSLIRLGGIEEFGGKTMVDFIHGTILIPRGSFLGPY